MIVHGKFIPNKRGRDIKLYIARSLLGYLQILRDVEYVFEKMTRVLNVSPISPSHLDNIDTDSLRKSIQYTVPADVYEKLTEGFEGEVDPGSLYLLTKVHEDSISLRQGYSPVDPSTYPQAGQGTIRVPTSSHRLDEVADEILARENHIQIKKETE